MSLRDCPKCWDYPCTCGYQQRQRDEANTKRAEKIAIISSLWRQKYGVEKKYPEKACCDDMFCRHLGYEDAGVSREFMAAWAREVNDDEG